MQNEIHSILCLKRINRKTYRTVLPWVNIRSVEIEEGELTQVRIKGESEILFFYQSYFH